MISTIENMLRNYTQNKAYVITALARVQAYEELLKCDDIENYVVNLSQKEIGMPRGSMVISSPVEGAVLKKQLTADDLKQMITDEKSRMFLKRLEVAQIDEALKSLMFNEKYIIECKYFENMFWKDIERSYNDKYKNINRVSEDMLKRLNKECLHKLGNVLEPFLKLWKIA